MKLKLILTTAIVGVALALPSVSSAAPPPPPTFQDSVSLTEAPGVALTPNPFFAFTIFDLNATSGPRGENPSGQVRFATLNLNIQLGGPVTCLAVSGNTATINFQDQMTFAGSIITVQVVDDQPDTFSSARLIAERQPTVLRFFRPSRSIHSPAATSRWSMHRCRPQRTNVRVTAGSSSASRTRGCASPSSTAARRRGPPGCRSSPEKEWFFTRASGTAVLSPALTRRPPAPLALSVIEIGPARSNQATEKQSGCARTIQ